jgi:hypothetical protein
LETQIKGAPMFIGLASQGAIAFACTVQQQKIPKKIENDLAAIASGAICKEVHYFLEVDFPVAKRHTLQKLAKDKYDVHLEIYDGAAIVEFLRDPDLFWIANEYLAIPADSYPRPPATESWYAELRGKWKNLSERDLSYAAFQEVKRATRSLITNSERQSDAEFWIARLNQFRSCPDQDLAVMAIYEIAVASLRIKESLIGLEGDIRHVFEHNKNSTDSARLLDCACLVSYASTAAHQNKTTLTTQELREIRSFLQDKIRKLLSESSDISQKCILLDLSAFIALVPDFEAQSPGDVSSAFSAWSKLLALVDRAPLFPLQEFANRLSEWVVFLVDYDGYEALITQAERFLAQRTGSIAVARNRMTRAKALSEAGRYIQAVHELNRAKIESFSDEALPMTLACLMLAARHYNELGMGYAAKYYSLAVSYIALNHDDPQVKRFVSRGIALAAELDYEHGSWLQALSLYRLVQVTHSNFSTSELTYADPDGHRILLYGSIILGIAQKQHQVLKFAAEAMIADWPDRDVITSQASKAEEIFVREADKGACAEVFHRPPFSDCIENQMIEWSGLGVEWTVKWTRGKNATIAAEQFVAISQILTCELARTDVYLLSGKALVNLIVDEGASSVKMERLPSNTESLWTLTVPTSLTAERHVEDMTAVVMVFQELSLKQSNTAVLEAIGPTGFQNTLAGNLYAKIMNFIGEPPMLEQSVPVDSRLQPLSFGNNCHSELMWNDELIGEYDPIETRSMLEKRYPYGAEYTKYTLTRVLSDAEFCRNVSDLSAAGWLDWQLLGAVSGLAQSWRAFGERMPASREEMEARARQFVYKEERSEWAPVPLGEFSRVNMERQLEMNMLNTLQAVGLVHRAQTPNSTAIKTFVKSKLRYFDDDIQHEDLFVQRSSMPTPDAPVSA